MCAIRNAYTATLLRMQESLAQQGYSVGPVVTPGDQWTNGLPYFTTNAPASAINNARRDAIGY